LIAGERMIDDRGSQFAAYIEELVSAIGHKDRGDRYATIA
jgi:hypothetical protein